MRTPPRCVNVETRAAVRSVEHGREGGILLDAGATIWRFTPTPMAAGGDYRFRAIRICSTRPGRVNGRQPQPAPVAGASVGGSYFFDGGFIGAAITQNDSAVSHSRHRGRRSRHPDRRAPDQIHRKRRISARCGGDRCHSLLGRRDRLQAQRDRPRRRSRSGDATACARPSPTRSRKAASKCSCSVQRCASLP